MPQNAREMMAILMAIHTFGPLVQNKALQIVTDNFCAMANINHMGGQSTLLTLITKAIDTTSISYQFLSVFMLREGRQLQFFVYKNGDPSSIY